MKKPLHRSTALLGAAGEHHVMCQLLRRGLIAALAPQGAPNMDIVLTSVDGEILRAIQVKSRRAIGSDGGWHMSAKHEGISAERLFYCFVDFGSDETAAPTTLVVPSEVVARVVRESHAFWLSRPGRKGQKRKDSSFRRFMPNYDNVFEGTRPDLSEGWLKEYLEAWHLLTSEKENSH